MLVVLSSGYGAQVLMSIQDCTGRQLSLTMEYLVKNKTKQKNCLLWQDLFTEICDLHTRFHLEASPYSGL